MSLDLIRVSGTLHGGLDNFSGMPLLQLTLFDASLDYSQLLTWLDIFLVYEIFLHDVNGG